MLRSQQGPQDPDLRGKEPGEGMRTLLTSVVTPQQLPSSGWGSRGWVLQGPVAHPCLPREREAGSQPSPRRGTGHF